MKNKLSKLISFTSLFFIIFLLLATIDNVSFQKDFYSKQYEKLEIAQFINISDADLMATTDVLLDYLQDDIDSLDLIVEIDGVKREVFNQKEKDHMIDVKNLYLNAMVVKNISLAIFVISILFLIFYKRKESLSIFKYSFIEAIKIFSVALVAIIFFAIVDFDALWRLLHEIFFTNDLWLLDINTDVMIMMFPLEFFNAIVIKIIMQFLVSIALVLTLCNFGLVSKYFKGEKTYD